MNEVRTKLQMRQEGAIKRERAMVYALTHQVKRLEKHYNQLLTLSGTFVFTEFSQNL